MDDKTFRELELKTICPNADQWPTEYMHQKTLFAAANEARAFLRDAYAKLDAVDANRDLSPEGKRRQRAKIAKEIVATIDASKTLERVREAVDHVMQKYQAKIDANIKPATDAQLIALYAQVRDRLFNVRDPKERIKFLEKHGSDLTLISAVLTAPAYLSGLSDAEYQYVRSQLERKAPREVSEAWAFRAKCIG
jgi:hypothetical protein